MSELPDAGAEPTRRTRLARQCSSQVEQVIFIRRATQKARHAWLSLVVLKWSLAARAVARGAKVGASLHRRFHVFYTYASPYASTYFGQFVLGFLCDLGFQVFKVSYCIGCLHSKFLSLEFQAMQRLYLGEADV